MTRFLLKRTHIEEFDYDPAKLREEFSVEYGEFAADAAKERERYGHRPLTEDEMWEWFVIYLFEKHDGSVYGDTLFSSTASDDIGVELFTRGDDE